MRTIPSWYAIQPDIFTDRWRVVNLTTGHVIVRALRRDKAMDICAALKDNQEKRLGSLHAEALT